MALYRAMSFNPEPELEPLLAQAESVVAVTDYLAYLYGSDHWLHIPDEDTSSVDVWMARYMACTKEDSDGSKWISANERNELLAMTLPSVITVDDKVNLLDRWNRSLDYWDKGIFHGAQVPIDQSSNFIAIDVLKRLATAASEAMAKSESAGYASVVEGMVAEIQNLKKFYLSQPSSSGICARVKLRTEQEAVIARDAFRATLEIDNADSQRLEQVQVTLSVTDESGTQVPNLFAIRAPDLVGLSGVDGNGILGGGSVGTAKWVIVPTVDAVPGASPVRYLVSGQFSYTQNGARVSVPLTAVPITVLPSPRLTLDYFHQRDVFSDDPFTDITEPSVPFNLAVMVQNKGYGIAKNFRITSAQPQIVENEKGLLIDFKIIATEVAGRSMTPTLLADFGNIEAGQTAIARWLMTSTLQGLFIDYKATFEHIDGLGNPKLSLIDQVNIHELNHLVQASGVFEDGKPDFLVNDIPDLRDMPDTLYLSDGRTFPVQVIESGANDGAPSIGRLQVQLQAAMPSGWAYLRVPEPSDGHYRLIGATRSDGTVIAMDKNVWTTDRTFIGMGKRPIRENILHLLDYDSTGSYTLFYEPLPVADPAAPISGVAALPANSYGKIPVSWSGQDNPGGSGVATYDVFVSIDDGAFAPWLERTTLTGSLYPGEMGKKYAFFSVATDMAGNRETPHAQADAVTRVTLINRAPTIAPIADQVLNAGDILLIPVSANDPDLPNDSIIFTMEGQPQGMTLTRQSDTAALLRWVTSQAGGAGAYTVKITISDSARLSASTSFSVTVNKKQTQQAPVITWMPPSDILYGTALSPAQLNAQADVDGTFTYDPPMGTVLSAGNQKALSVTFVPKDAVGNTTASAVVKINVLKAQPVLTWASFGDLPYGTGLSAAHFNITASVPGSFSYAPVLGTILPLGDNQTLLAAFTPADSANYASATASLKVNVVKAVPLITWAAPAAMKLGAKLSKTQLNATANVPGTWLYTPPMGAPLGEGSHILTVMFTPEDKVHYLDASKQVTVAVLANLPPVPGSYTLIIRKDQVGTIAATRLVSAASDPEGSTITVDAVNTVSVQGGAIKWGAGIIAFTPKPGYTGDDSFQYTLKDSQGATAVGTVRITINPPAASPNQLGVIVDGDGAITVRFAGIPRLLYDIQARSSLTGGEWTTLNLNPVAAGVNGVIEFTDTDTANNTIRFYRTVLKNNNW